MATAELEQTRREIKTRNSGLIVEGFQRLFSHPNSSGDADDIKGFVELNDGLYLLGYGNRKKRNRPSEVFTIATFLINHRSGILVASMTYDFDEYPFDHVLVIPELTVHVNWQSRGIGTGFVRAKETVIQETIQRNRPAFEGKTVICKVRDNSRGRGFRADGTPIVRNQWTSHHMQLMGYAQDPNTPEMWVKCFSTI